MLHFRRFDFRRRFLSIDFFISFHFDTDISIITPRRSVDGAISFSSAMRRRPR